MVTEVDSHDLRVLSLLHALCDRDEFIREAVRLLLLPGTDKSIWYQIRSMGWDVAPGHPLFDPKKAVGQLREEFSNYPREEDQRITFDRRRGERRAAQRRAESDRRMDERRAIRLPWLGAERRATDRRQCMRRQADSPDPA